MKKVILALTVGVVMLSAWQTAKVVSVTDGDTLWLKKDTNDSFKVRLIGIDTFETKMNHRIFKQIDVLKYIYPKKSHTVKEVLALGHKAKRFVVSQALNKEINYNSYGVDQYGRELVYIKNLNYLLLREGLATLYPAEQIHKERRKFLKKVSKLAKRDKVGIYER